MFFGKQHSWQGCSDVQQVLVFKDLLASEDFDVAFSAIAKAKGIENTSENGLGADYKLRALLSNDETWIALIRDAATGTLLAESRDVYNSPEEALESCREFVGDMNIQQLKEKIANSLNLPWFEY